MVAEYSKTVLLGKGLAPHLANNRLQDAHLSNDLPRRKTKTVCTIGPTSCDREAFFRLADAGMNVVRLNMSHGDHASHQVRGCGVCAGVRARAWVGGGERMQVGAWRWVGAWTGEGEALHANDLHGRSG